MRLVTFDSAGRRGIGAIARGGDTIVDLGVDPVIPGDMVSLIRDWADLGARAERAALDGREVPAAVLRAPLMPPSDVMCVGKNYREHVREFSTSGYDPTQTTEFPPHPVVFTKSRSAVTDPGAGIPVSLDSTGTTDYEGEIAVVIGTGGFRIAAADAMAHVFGYTILNDLSVRELQRRHGQFFLAKSLRGYCPIGPAILTADEVDDPGELRVRTRVNGELRQDGYLRDINFGIPELIEAISWSVELSPGDVIATGTPGGVGIGFTPPRYLVPGDRVEIEVDSIGVLANDAV